MSRIIRTRWRSKFARFIQYYGVESLAKRLDSNPPRSTTGSEVRPLLAQLTPRSCSVLPVIADPGSRWTKSMGIPAPFASSWAKGYHRGPWKPCARRMA